MQVPSNSQSLGTVRSTVLLVALLASAFIVFDSYNWQILSVSWSQKPFAKFRSESRSNAAPTITPVPNSFTVTEDTPRNVATSDIVSDDDDDSTGRNARVEAEPGILFQLRL